MAKTPQIHKYPYPDCDYVTKQKGNLAVHICRKHTGEKPFKCKDHPQGDPKCDYAAAQSSQLMPHIRRQHTGEKPYQCSYPKCDYAAAESFLAP